jgi:hypothetical protein
MQISSIQLGYRYRRGAVLAGLLALASLSVACASWIKRDVHGFDAHCLEGWTRTLTGPSIRSRSVLISGQVASGDARELEEVIRHDVMPVLRAEREISEVRAFTSDNDSQVRFGIVVTVRSSTSDPRLVMSHLASRLSHVTLGPVLGGRLNSLRVDLLEQRDDLSVVASSTIGRMH